MNNKYSVYEPNLSVLTAKLTRLNTKLSRINIAPITWKQVGHRDEPHPSIENAVVRYIDLEVEGKMPVENGWAFAATVVHTDDGNIIRAVPGYSVPVEYRDRPTWCDHCRTNRARRDTYIVRHEDGRVMQVGSSCLADFIGTSNPNGLVRAAEVLLNGFDVCEAAQKKEWLGGTNAISTYRIDLDTFLQHVAAIVLRDGRYITRKLARSTEGTPYYRSATSDRAQAEMAHGHGGVNDDAKKLATEARAWVLRTYGNTLSDPECMNDDAVGDMVDRFFKTNVNLSDFEHNLLACARSEAIEPRLCGIAAYIVEAYRRQLAVPVSAHLNPEGLRRIFGMFDAAKQSKLTRPAIRLADEAGHKLNLSLAGDTSKNAGYIYVKNHNGYCGKISPTGQFFPAGACPATVEPQLTAFAADPETVASKYGKLTGHCCFCGRALNDERSTEVGYGPVCAGKFGFSWGCRNVEPEQAVNF